MKQIFTIWPTRRYLEKFVYRSSGTCVFLYGILTYEKFEHPRGTKGKIFDNFLKNVFHLFSIFGCLFLLYGGFHPLLFYPILQLSRRRIGRYTIKRRRKRALVERRMEIFSRYCTSIYCLISFSTLFFSSSRTPFCSFFLWLVAFHRAKANTLFTGKNHPSYAPFPLQLHRFSYHLIAFGKYRCWFATLSLL